MQLLRSVPKLGHLILMLHERRPRRGGSGATGKDGYCIWMRSAAAAPRGPSTMAPSDRAVRIRNGEVKPA